jgi:hypothetical protein
MASYFSNYLLGEKLRIIKSRLLNKKLSNNEYEELKMFKHAVEYKIFIKYTKYGRIWLYTCYPQYNQIAEHIEEIRKGG